MFLFQLLRAANRKKNFFKPQPSARPEGSVYQPISSPITLLAVRLPSRPALCPLSIPKDKRLDPAAAKARPVRQQEEAQPPGEAGEAPAPPPPSLARGASSVCAGQGSRASSRLSILPLAPALPPPPAPVAPTLGVRMCSMASPRLLVPGG